MADNSPQPKTITSPAGEDFECFIQNNDRDNGIVFIRAPKAFTIEHNLEVIEWDCEDKIVGVTGGESLITERSWFGFCQAPADWVVTEFAIVE